MRANQKSKKKVQKIKQNKQYRKTKKVNEFKTQKSNNQRQQEYKLKNEQEQKKRMSLYLSFDNIAKIENLQKYHQEHFDEKISKSDAINLLLDEVIV